MILALAGCSSGKKETASPSLPDTLEESVSGPLRTAENKKRDQYRHPLETLKFFGVEKDMTVVEIWPSGGWYTQILAPYLAEKGQYIIADPAADPKGYTTPRSKWLENHPEIAKTVKKVTFAPGKKIDLGQDNSADMVLTFRNVHNWLPVKNQEEAFNSFYKVLKPGGILGVVEHRANTKKPFKPESGYVPEKEVIKLAEQAGFKLAEKSNINANPKDTADHPEGVWTLPPALRLGDKNKEKYLEIGESDRMTLKFVKPE